MPTALCLHHDANSSIGHLGGILAELGYAVREHFICRELDSGITSGPLPGLVGIDLLIPLGSRWSVYDTDNIGTWIEAEVAMVCAADSAAIPVLGICFGGQLLAHALGGAVRPAAIEEIGWMMIEADNAPFAAGPWFQWHLDVFDPPPEATLLATSAAGAQAFRLRNNLALQFHPEVTAAVLEEWLLTDRDQLRDCGIDPDDLLATTALEHHRGRDQTRDLVARFLASIETVTSTSD